MDVMQPVLVCVDGANYRFFESNFWNNRNYDNDTTTYFNDGDVEKFEDLESAFGSIDEFFETPDVETPNETVFDENFENETPPSNIEIPFSEIKTSASVIEIPQSEIDIVTQDGQLKHSFNLNMRYFPLLVGHKGRVKTSIEFETDTSISLPPRGKGNEVVITGRDAEGIIAAKHKINAIVEHSGFNLDNDAKSNEVNPYDDDASECDDFDEAALLDIEIVTTRNGSYKHEFFLDRKYYGLIIGPRQMVKYEIETLTGAHLRIPRRCEPSIFVIVGPTKRAVASAKRKVVAIIEKHKNYLHGKQSADVEVPKIKEPDDCDENTRHPDIKVVPAGNGKYTHSFLTDRKHFSYIIGPNGSMCKEIYMKTGAHVSVPKLGEGKEIVIRGPSPDGVIAARYQIDAAIEKSKNHIDSTKKIDVLTTNGQEFDDFEGKTPVEDIKIVPGEKSGYKHTYYGETRFFPIIVGHGGDIKHRIEMDTDTCINIPRAGEGNEVVIKGSSKERIVSARHQIDAIVQKFKIQNGYTTNIDNKRLNTQEIHDFDKKTSTTEIKIVSEENGRFKCVFPMQWRYYPLIIGTGGSVKKSIEKETDTYLDVPRLGQNNVIVITGHNKQGIVAARLKIDEIIKTHKIIMDNRINNSEFTHFISIPMNDSTIASNYVTFKNVVLNETGKDSRGVREEIFQKPEKLHLVVGMLVLTHPRDVLSAIETLNECKEIIIKPFVEKNRPIKLKAQGLSSLMTTDDLTDALRCKITTENNVLQTLVDEIVDFFMERGLMTKETSRLMDLNIKLMSSKFDKKEPSKYFDVNDILREHEDHFFGEIKLSTIHISKRGSYDDNGYYAAVAKIRIP